MKRVKKTAARIFSAAFACSLIFSAGAWAKTGETDAKQGTSVRTESPAGLRSESGDQSGGVLRQIAISVGDGQNTPVFQAGEKTALNINVTNKGNADARNVRISPVVESTDQWPFDMDKLNYELDLGTISAGTQKAAVWGSEKEPLTVSSGVTGKSYQLLFRITYDDGQKLYETEKYVFVKTEAAQKPDDGKDGEDQTGDSQNGQTSQKPDNGGGADVLAPGGIYNDDPAPSGGGGGTESASVPRVIVTGFSTEPGEVKAGTDFRLIVHLKNTSKRTAVSNMLFDFQAPAAGTDAAAEAPAFLPVSGSSSVYLENIAAGGTKDISIDLNARADLVQKPYSITMSMQYEDKNAVQYQGQSSLAIPVKQEARYEFSEIQVNPAGVSVGEEANITCSLYNLGQVKMYNVKVRFEGQAIQGQEQFIGNLESGASGTIDAIVSAVEESYDESNCKLVLTYEDDAGNVSAVEQPFTVTVGPMEEIMDTGMIGELPDEPESSPLPGILAALAAAIVLAVIAVLAVRKHRKKKRMEEEEEEWMDEVERFTEDEREQP